MPISINPALLGCKPVTDATHQSVNQSEYASTLMCLAQSLANLDTIDEERISRLLALCPKLPIVNQSINQHNNQVDVPSSKLTEIQLISQAFNQSINLSSSWSVLTNVLKGHTYGPDDCLTSISINQSNQSIGGLQELPAIDRSINQLNNQIVNQSIYQTKFEQSTHSPLDERSQAAFLALLKYLNQSCDQSVKPSNSQINNQSVQSNKQAVNQSLIPLVLKQLLALPFMRWESQKINKQTINQSIHQSTNHQKLDKSLISQTNNQSLFLSVHPAAQFTSDIVTHLISISHKYQSINQSANPHVHKSHSQHLGHHMSSHHISFNNQMNDQSTSHSPNQTIRSINSAVLILLRQLILIHINLPILATENSQNSQNAQNPENVTDKSINRNILHFSSMILTGLLYSLGESSLIHDEFSANELMGLLIKLLKRSSISQSKDQSVNQSKDQSITQMNGKTHSEHTDGNQSINQSVSQSVKKSTITPAMHALSLKALVNLLSQNSSLITQSINQSINQSSSHSKWGLLFEQYVQPLNLISYKQPVSQSVNQSINQSPSHRIQASILTYSLHLSLMCGLIDPSINQSVLSKYKEVLDKCLNVKYDDETVNQTINQSVKKPASNPRVMVGCVEVIQAIMIGFVELSRQSINQSINQSISQASPSSTGSQMSNSPSSQSISQSVTLMPVILETCRLILLTSRRLMSHPYQSIIWNQSINAIGNMLINELMHQSVNQSINQSANQHTNSQFLTIPTSHSHHALNQSVNQSINQSSNQSSGLPHVLSSSQLNKSTNQTVHQSIYQSSICRSFIQSVLSGVMRDEVNDQSTNQSINQRQLIFLMDLMAFLNHSQHQSLTPSVSQSINQSFTPAINQSIHQSINQSINEANNQVLPLIIKRFGARPKNMFLIMDRLIDIAIDQSSQSISQSVDPSNDTLVCRLSDRSITQSNNQLADQSSNDFDGIITLLFNVYRNRSINQSLNQLGNPSINQPVNQLHTSYSSSNITAINNFTNQSIEQSNNQLISRSNEASINQSANQSINQSINQIPQTLTRLANGLMDQDRRIQMMKRMLRLISEIAYEVSHQSTHQSINQSTNQSVNQSVNRTPKSAHDCGALLPVIASLLCPNFDHSHGNPPVAQSTNQSVGQSINQSIDQSDIDTSMIGVKVWSSRESNVKWFRRCWYVITHFGFATNQSVNKSSNQPTNQSIIQSIRAIAAHSPVLLIDNKRDYLTSELEGEALRFPSINQTINNQPITQANMLPMMQKRLTDLLSPHMSKSTNQSIDASSLSMAKILFLLAVHELETQRILAYTSVSQSSNQSINQSNPQSVNQSINQSINPGFAPMFAYIADEDVHKAGIHQWIRLICSSVFDTFVRTINQSINQSIRQSMIEQHVNFLIKKLCSRYASERNQSISMINRLIDVFPFIQWSTSCLTGLLTMYQLIDASIDTQVQLSANQSINPSNNQLVDFPESLALRQSINHQLIGLALDWLKNSHDLVPHETLMVIQQYIHSTSQSINQPFNRSISPTSQLINPSINHSGISLILRQINQSINHSTNPSVIHSGLSSLITSLAQKENYLGEIRGIYHQWQLDQSINQSNNHSSSVNQSVSQSTNQDFGIWLSNQLMKKSTELLSEYRSLTCPSCYPPINQSTNQPFNQSTTQSNKSKPTACNPGQHAAYVRITQSIEQLIYHAAALLVLSSSDQSTNQSINQTINQPLNVLTQDLLHLTCKLPAQVFNQSIMNAAIFAWEWINQSINQSIQLMLLIEMKAAWSYTIDRQVGLFSGKRSTNQSINQSAQSKSGLMYTCETHPSVVCLLPLPSLNQPINQSTNQSAVQPSVSQASHHYEEVAPHVLWIRHLTTYYQSISHSNPSINQSIINILQSMMHKAFARPELIQSTNQSMGARFRLMYLALKLMGSVQSVNHPFNQSVNQSINQSIDYSVDGSLLRDRLMGVAFSWFYQRAGWYDGQSINALNDSVDALIQVRAALQERSQKLNQSTNQSTNQSVNQSINQSINEKQSRYRDLLLFLLGHELVRMQVWNNPGGHLTNFHIPDQSINQSINQSTDWESYTRTAWEIAPILAIRFAQRFPTVRLIDSTLKSLVRRHPEAVYDLSDAVIYLVNSENVRQNVPELRNLVYWSPTTLSNALRFFSPPFCLHRMVMEYAVHTLYCHPVDQVVFYLAQIVQCLKNDHFKLLYEFLVRSSHFSILLSHQLIWLCQAELGEVHATGKPLEMTPFRILCQTLMKEIINQFTPAERAYFEDQFALFEQVTAISGILKPLPTKAERKIKIKSELEKIIVKPGLYLPTNPKLQVREIICSSGTPMQSAAKVPILVAFMVVEQELDEDWIRSGGREAELAQRQTGEKHLMLSVAEDSREAQLVEDKYPVVLGAAEIINKAEAARRAEREAMHRENSEISTSRRSTDEIHLSTSEDEHLDLDTDEQSNNQSINQSSLPRPLTQKPFPQACIFKVGDDCRQDALALQVIAWCKQIFDLHDLPLYLYPYHVLPNRTGGSDGLVGGIIECVPAAQTRDELGKAYGGSLSAYYRSKYGTPESARYLEAQRNFICSEAAYAITSYILQVKDRHNGNLMWDSQGHVVHIDFGFIFTISPAGNLNFESPAFKLTEEMVELMGGIQSVDSLFNWFKLLVVRGFLACREHYTEIEAMVQPMLGSSLSCFRGDALGELTNRFFPDKTESEAADEMLKLIDQANANWRTNGYDWIQAKQQGVFYYKKGHGDD